MIRRHLQGFTTLHTSGMTVTEHNISILPWVSMQIVSFCYSNKQFKKVSPSVNPQNDVHSEPMNSITAVKVFITHHNCPNPCHTNAKSAVLPGLRTAQPFSRCCFNCITHNPPRTRPHAHKSINTLPLFTLTLQGFLLKSSQS